MRTRRRNVVSDDPLTITQRNTRAKKETSVNGTEDSIPIDLIIEILSRLSARSVARCRCVSKLWASILRRPDFRELFLMRSRRRPQLLFAVQKKDKLLFLSAPQPQNPDPNSSPVVRVNPLMHFPFNDYSWEIVGTLHGLVCLLDNHIINGRNKTVVMICNPSTGQSLTLPRVKTGRVGVSSYLGFDPIDKEFKVLAMSSKYSVFDEHQVLTIGASGRRRSWRLIECCIPPHYLPRYSTDKMICISGVLYYLARLQGSSRYSIIVCFDVRSEKFRFITLTEALASVVDYGILINYNGKLGLMVLKFVDVRSGSFEFWVLEDGEKQEWSKLTFQLPVTWLNRLGINTLYLHGVTCTNEFVFMPPTNISMPFCHLYYNTERNTITRVGIQGMEAFENSRRYKFLDYVEDVKLLQVFN